MSRNVEMEFFIDQSRCIGCEACVQVCGQCDGHKGESMIHLDTVDFRRPRQSMPTVCMHCDEPACAAVCPTDAIKKTPDGVVQSARRERCIGCDNCGLACPFGVPKLRIERDMMMKCDMCYDRTSQGKKPMCASVCPSGALFYGTRAQLAAQRPLSKPVNTFVFGDLVVRTKVSLLVPVAQGDQLAPPNHLGSPRVDDIMLDSLYVPEES